MKRKLVVSICFIFLLKTFCMSVDLKWESYKSTGQTYGIERGESILTIETNCNSAQKMRINRI